MTGGTGAIAASCYLAGLVVAVVLGVAAVAKARHPRSTAAAFEGLGLPRPATLARAVPAVEVGVAVALAVAPAAGGAAALLLLAAFTGILLRARSGGAAVPCGCFGATTSRPVGRADVVRNGVLALASLAAVAGAEPRWPGVDAVVLVGTAAVVGAVVVGLARLRDELGALWAIALAGEPRAGSGAGLPGSRS